MLAIKVLGPGCDNCRNVEKAAKSAVAAPINATTAKLTGAIENSTLHRETIYTPDVTIVAACISALVGVGPSIASGSQT